MITVTVLTRTPQGEKTPHVVLDLRFKDAADWRYHQNILVLASAERRETYRAVQLILKEQGRADQKFEIIG